MRSHVCQLPSVVCCKLQAETAVYATEAEYVALTQATIKVLPSTNFLTESNTISPLKRAQVLLLVS